MRVCACSAVRDRGRRRRQSRRRAQRGRFTGGRHTYTHTHGGACRGISYCTVEDSVGDMVGLRRGDALSGLLFVGVVSFLVPKQRPLPAQRQSPRVATNQSTSGPQTS